MNKNKLSALTKIELNQQKGALKNILIATVIVLFVLSSIILYLGTKNHNSAILTVLPCLLLMLVPGFIKWNQLNTELKSRL